MKKRKNLTQPILFYNRESETKFIQKRVKKNRNVYIVAPDGYGKTSLINHCLDHFKVDNRTIIITIDLIFFSTFKQFLNVYLNSLSTLALNRKNLDALNRSDEPQNLSETDLLKKLNQILEKINEGGKKILIVLDNVQHSYNYRTERFESLLLNPMINTNGILVILSGTKKLFSLKETDDLSLEKIDDKKYRNYVNDILKKNRINFSKKAYLKIYEWTGGDISAMSTLFERASKLGKKKIREKEVNDTIDQLMIEMNSAYSIIKNLLSPYQWKLLVAIALQDSHYQITSSSFITRHELNAPSSVKTALDALTEKELITRTERHYVLRSRLLKNWIAFNNNQKVD